MAKAASIVIAPRLSVVMSLYNSERYLREAIDSVLAQTMTDFEFIIIDDGSSDGGADIVRSYEDSRIRYLYQDNAGLPAALNAAIELAQANIIARMDPDDICLPDRLFKQYKYMVEHEEVVVVGTAASCIDESGALLPDIKVTSYYEVGAMPLPESPCVHPSVVFRRVVFERVGGYPECMRYGGEDAVLFNRMLAHGCVANLSEALLKYRLHHSSMSHKSRRFNRLLRQIIYKKVRGKPVSDLQLQKLAKEYGYSGSGRYGYQLYVGKLFLSCESMEPKARACFFKAIWVRPLSLYAWACLASSFIPGVCRARLRQYLTSWRNGYGQR